MKKKASFTFKFDSSEEAKLIKESLSPEIKHKIPKANVEISISKNILFLKIESDDVSTLRAACNSYLRWINTAITVNQLV
jgi:tRNA threonylcarbamoyladenosine modification (KEOPS) complex  Pcc1 subunit